MGEGVPGGKAAGRLQGVRSLLRRHRIQEADGECQEPHDSLGCMEKRPKPPEAANAFAEGPTQGMEALTVEEALANGQDVVKSPTANGQERIRQNGVGRTARRAAEPGNGDETGDKVGALAIIMAVRDGMGVVAEGTADYL
jgi:hypothetical protein